MRLIHDATECCDPLLQTSTTCRYYQVCDIHRPTWYMHVAHMGCDGIVWLFDEDTGWLYSKSPRHLPTNTSCNNLISLILNVEKMTKMGLPSSCLLIRLWLQFSFYTTLIDCADGHDKHPDFCSSWLYSLGPGGPCICDSGSGCAVYMYPALLYSVWGWKTDSAIVCWRGWQGE